MSCSLTTLPHEVQTSLKNTESSIDAANRQLINATTKQHDTFVKHTATGYFGNQAIVQSNTDFLPPIFMNQIQVDREFYGLQQVATSLTDLTHMPTILDLSLHDHDNCQDIRITQQDGTLADLLNVIAARCDLTWSYRQGKLILADMDTRTWNVQGIPGDIQVQNQINNNTGVQSQSGANGTSTGSASGGGGGGSGTTGQSQSNANLGTTQNIAFNLQNNLWHNLQDAIKSMLSKDGRLSISPATSSLTVTDRPSVLMRIDHYMQGQNRILKRMVQIDIQVLNVDVDRTDNYGINWNAVLQGATAGFTINGQAPGQAISGTSGSNAALVFNPTDVTQAFTISANSGDLSGSQLIINALSSKAKTSLVTSTAVSTLSNQPVPLQFVDQLSYLASVSTMQMFGTGEQTSLTPGQVTTGFSLNVLPVIEADNKVELQLSINISSLQQMSSYSSAGSSIELPDTLQRNFMQKVVIKSGDTFVVTGFDSQQELLNNNGVGSTSSWWLGGGVSANRTRSRMVILVTPHVID